MKKIILITLTALFAVNVFAGCAGPGHSPEPGNAPASVTSFSKEDWKMLLTLAPEEYEDMTVSDFRKHIQLPSQLTQRIWSAACRQRISSSP